MKTFIVQKSEAGQTLEKYVKKSLSNVSLSTIYKLFRKKDIKVNKKWKDAKYIVSAGEIIQVYIKDELLDDTIKPQLMPSNKIEPWIVYEDENVLIVNKPRGILVQKADVNGPKSLDQMVLEYLFYKKEYNPEVDTAFKPGPAHRIDRNTSGLVLFGKNIETLQYLFYLLKDREELSKHYLALVKGVVEQDGIVEAPLKKDEETGKVIVDSIKDGAKKAKTLYHVLKRFDNYTLLDLTLVTGRTHQIRVHMQYIGHPLVGDAKYGDFELNRRFEKMYKFKNQFLHAYELDFGNVDYPLNRLKNQNIIGDMPKEYTDILEKINK